MKRILLAALAALLFLSSSITAEIYQCRAIKGCVAHWNKDDGSQGTIVMRKGDILSSDNGWIVSTDDGWVRLRGLAWTDNPVPVEAFLDLWAWLHAQAGEPILIRNGAYRHLRPVKPPELWLCGWEYCETFWSV